MQANEAVLTDERQSTLNAIELELHHLDPYQFVEAVYQLVDDQVAHCRRSVVVGEGLPGGGFAVLAGGDVVTANAMRSLAKEAVRAGLRGIVRAVTTAIEAPNTSAAVASSGLAAAVPSATSDSSASAQLDSLTGVEHASNSDRSMPVLASTSGAGPTDACWRCAICLEGRDAGVADARPRHALTCGHVFHTDCINQWLDHGSSCPCCRNQEQSESAEESAESGDSGESEESEGLEESDASGSEEAHERSTSLPVQSAHRYSALQGKHLHVRLL